MSKISAQQVRDVIENVKPDCVVLELCASRAAKLQKMKGEAPPPIPFLSLIMPKGGGVLQSIISMMYHLFSQLGFEPGGEFAAALEECDKRRIPVVLGDQVLVVFLIAFAFWLSFALLF